MEKQKRNIIHRVILFLLPIVAFSLIFLTGSMHSESQNERVANYAAQVALNNTVNKNFCGIAVDTPNKPTQFYDTEFINLFGVFAQRQATYASALNADKSNDVRINLINSENLSLFYLGPTGSISQEIDNKTVFRHSRYNVSTMFEDPDFNGTYFDKNHLPVIYLSFEQATKLLIRNGVEKKDGKVFLDKDYYNLIQQPLDLSINGVAYQYYIWNIYYNDGFYCDGLSDVLGEYVLTSYYQRGNLLDTHKSIYFFNRFEYQNNYFISYINTQYEKENTRISVLHNNLTSEIDESFLLSFFKNSASKKTDWIFPIGVSLTISLLSFDIFWANKMKPFEKKYIDIVWVFISLLPYLIFKLVFFVTKDNLFFSNISSKTNFILLLLFYFSMLACKLINNRKHWSYLRKNSYCYEINI